MTINKVTRDDLENMRRWISREGSDLTGYQRIAAGKASYPGKGTALGVIYLAGKLNGEAGEMAGQIFKAMRDDDLVIEDTNEFRFYDLTPERRAKIIAELGDVLWYVAALAGELGIDLSALALENLEKLAGRTERGTLQGDGER